MFFFLPLIHQLENGDCREVMREIKHSVIGIFLKIEDLIGGWGGAHLICRIVLYFVKYGIVTSAGYLKIYQVYTLAYLCFGSEILE
jgi:hypothetical protein